MKKYTIILKIILILLCTNGCRKEEISKDKSSIPKEPNTTLTMKFGSFKDGYNLNPFAIELELSNNRSENYIIPWCDDYEQGNAVLYLRPFGTTDEWLVGSRFFNSSHRIFPRVYEMVLPTGGKLNFWINLWGNYRPPSELTPGKYQVYAALAEYPDVITTTKTINLYDDPSEKEYDISPALDLIIDPDEEPVPINLSFQSLPEKVSFNFNVDIIFELENNQNSLRGIDPWYFNNKFNVQLLYRPAGTNVEWKSIRELHFIREISNPSVRCTQLLPPKSKLTFPVPLRFWYSSGEYEVYARLTALPKVKTEIKIIQAVRE